MHPSEARAPGQPGTASTGRPSSRAKSAVMSAPERAPASTTATAPASPATIRLRAGKRHGAGGVPGQNSETSAPASATRRASPRLRRG